MQFPLETVREVAQLLTESGLSEISLQSTGEAPAARLTLRRAAPVYAAAPVAVEESGDEPANAGAEEPALEAGPEHITIASPAVGVFRAAKPALEVGDEVKRKQQVAIVEALKIPNELYAPDSARVVEVLVADGQGVEWGQPLLILEPLGK